jgi:hypothetical protein
MKSGRTALFLDVATELLARGHAVRFRAEGCSMHPTIRSGEAIVVKPVSPGELRKGDIALYRGKRGVVAHRVMLTRGDAPGSTNEPVEPWRVLGKVVAVERNLDTIVLGSTKAKIRQGFGLVFYRCKRWMRARVDAAFPSGAARGPVRRSGDEPTTAACTATILDPKHAAVPHTVSQ